jgi:hypothetical protein
MTSHINKKNIGKLAITVSLLVWLIDRLTYAISTTLGKIIYGDLYTYPVVSMTGDLSYKFNIDMYLAYSLFSVFLLGILLYYSSLKNMAPIEENSKNTNTNN